MYFAAIFMLLFSFSLDTAAEEEGICVRVRIELSQDVVIARKAFKATLAIINTPENVPLENLTVILDITDENDQSANGLFGIHPPELSGIGDVNGTGIIESGTTATASWLLVPSRETAPDGPVMYYVGGEFSYTQGGSTITMPLFPAPILVKPDPLLVLDYFWAKDIYSDDPFTPKTEPAEPFPLGLMIRNNGKGVADNFRIMSAQPQIIENEKGLLVDFKIIDTQVNAASTSPSLSVNLGNIDPGTISVAKWMMTSSLQGTFKDYKADFVHIDGLGNPRLSLIDTVNIHELNHAVRVDTPSDDNKPDFLVNDVPDDDHLPDTLYNSAGPIEAVTSVLNASTDWRMVNGHWEAQLTATVPGGWVYIRTTDPGQDQYRLLRVVRSDGREIRLDDNAWTTHRTKRLVGQPPYREHLLHFFDKDGTGSYTLIYESSGPADTTPPSLEMVTPVPTPTNNLNPLYTFNSSEAGIITYSGSCESLTTAAVADNNTITLTGPDNGSLADGTYDNCAIIVTDAAGNASDPLSINTFIVDITPPTIAIAPVTTLTRLTSQTITGTVEAETSVFVATDTVASDGEATISGSTWSYTINNLVEGPNNITVTAKDAVGNITTAESSIVLDPSLPWLAGDCDESEKISTAEVQAAINMYLGLKAVQECVDTDNSGSVSITEVQKVINGYLGL